MDALPGAIGRPGAKPPVGRIPRSQIVRDQPLPNTYGTYGTVSMINRRGNFNGRPPRRGSRVGGNGAITIHWASVEDVSRAGLTAARS
ncbi:hypothetical protein Plo01_56970 [Planobispora longispora]|uniref:Uncharacterized protein n=1 Tax=Planobispora longispora TaxID=28887 RepID=A0A8J3RQI1_9ACTN|nr:hypothetical protein GCM10020093_032130 [Planobispora longispora]GIH79268.1 hypothetical protein Plo01_56970 [Planobispora longispora]